jgi:hypothetical protein
VEYVNVDVGAHLEDSLLQSSRKSMKKWYAEFQIPKCPCNI